jgi:CRP-like cAMP-binding protein
MKVITPFQSIIYQVYFIKKGSVKLVLRDHEDFIVKTVPQGYYFGEMSLFFNRERPYIYKTKEFCVLLTLSRKNFKKIFNI